MPADYGIYFKYKDGVNAFGFYASLSAGNIVSNLWARSEIQGETTEWQQIPTGIPSFYKNYNSLAELKAALAAI